MTQEELLKSLAEFHREAFELTKAKNSDYTAKGEALANFRACEKLGLCDTWTGILVRMIDKMMRLIAFERLGAFEVKSESVHDTCMDLSNYSHIYDAYCREKAEGEESAK